MSEVQGISGGLQTGIITLRFTNPTTGEVVKEVQSIPAGAPAPAEEA